MYQLLPVVVVRALTVELFAEPNFFFGCVKSLTSLQFRCQEAQAQGTITVGESPTPVPVIKQQAKDFDARVNVSDVTRIVLEEHLGVKRGKEVGQLLKDASRIGDERLRAQVADAVELDRYYGPHVDTVKRFVGLEYECILQQKLVVRGVPFSSDAVP